MFTPAPVSFLPEVLITPLSVRHGLGLDSVSGLGGTVPTSAAWLVANTAWHYPLYIDRPGLVTKFFTLNGAAAAGNMDIGLYDRNYNLIVAKGSTAQAGTNVIQEYDVTDFWINRGVYFLGLVNNGTTGAIFRSGVGNASFLSVMGVTMQATAFPLPSTATPAVNTFQWALPVAGIAFRALVA
jgi:hypothetical protein